MVTKVAIVGAGPCGTLLAHYLMRRGKYQIDIYDRRSDPRIIPFSSYRTYPLGLCERGLNALRKIEGLEEVVKAQTVETTGGRSYFKAGKSKYSKRNKPIYITDRTKLAIALLDELTKKYDSSQVKIHFDRKCTGVNVREKTAFFEEADSNNQQKFAINYDVLVGADGVRSKVRNSLLDTELFEFEQKYLPNAYKTLFLSNADKHREHNTFQAGTLYGWSIEDGTRLLAVPQLDKTVSCLMSFPEQKNSIAKLSNLSEVLTFFAENFPEIAQNLAKEEAEAFLKQPISRIMTVRCNRYHYGDSVLIIGDAAHAVAPSLGQGCNSAMEDVLVLDSVLDEYKDNWAETLSQFTLRRVPDINALSELSEYSFPLSRTLFVELLLRRNMGRITNKLLPQYFPPFFSERVSDTTTPYSEILPSARSWLNKVKKSNQKFLEN
ncbi:MAG: FAD-dependent oxidoreductase [Xenococcaceae cyanobacterium]